MYFGKPSFDPTDAQVKKDKTPILLIHGSGFNESEWIVGRQFLKKEEYGSVFSLNLDGLASNESEKGIEDYAYQKVLLKIREIKEKTGQNEVILIGHSMGGMVAGHYAEHFARAENTIVKHVISIATPWQGAPLLGSCLFKNTPEIRYQQMRVDSVFRQTLAQTAVASDKAGHRKYYTAGSTTDFMVPAPASNLALPKNRQYTTSWLGHYGAAIHVGTWLQIRSWLDAAYAAQKAPAIAAPQPAAVAV